MRTKNVNGESISFSPEEEAARDAEEMVWANSQESRDACAARVATDLHELAACSNDSAVMGLVNQTRAEWVSWAGVNFPTLTAAEKTRLGVLF